MARAAADEKFLNEGDESSESKDATALLAAMKARVKDQQAEKRKRNAVRDKAALAAAHKGK